MATEGRSVAELLSDALNQFTTLIRTEIALARAEMASKGKQAALGIGLAMGGALVSLAALVLLLMALAHWLVDLGLSDPVAHLLAAVVGLVLSGILVMLGANRLKPQNLTPERTIQEVQRDVATVKDQVT